MTEKALLKEDVKKKILALLVSCPAALTIGELKRDYHDFMGDPLPYRQLGYDTAEDFFRDIPDTVYPSWKNGMMVIEAVSNDSVRHIAKLVSKQKMDPKSKKKYQVYRRGQPPRNYGYQPPSRSRPPPPTAFHVPIYVRNQIKMLFKSYKDGLPLTHFETAYSKRFGTHINYTRLGFPSLRHLLSMIPDTVSLQELQGGEWRVLDSSSQNSQHSHIKPLLQTPVASMPKYENQYSRPQQAPLTSSDIRRPPQHQGTFNSAQQHQTYEPLSSTQQYQTYEPRSSTQQHQTYEPRSSTQQHQTYEPRSSIETIPKQENLARTAPPPRGRGKRSRASSGSSERRPGPMPVPESIDVGNSCSSSENSFTFGDETGISERVQDDLRKVLESKPNGIWASRLPFEFKNFHGKELCFQDIGYLSVIEFVSALPDIIRIERPTPKGDWLLTDVRIPRPEPEEQKVQQKPQQTAPVRERHKSQKAAVDEGLKATIRHVLLSKPDGILLGEFPAVFEETIGRPLPSVESLGFPRLDSFLLSLTDTVLQLSYKGEGRIMLFALDAGESTYPSLRPDDQKTSEKLELVLDSSTKHCIPQDAVGPGIHYRFQPLPGKFGSYVEVYISNIVSPGLFWLQLRGKNTTMTLEKMMDDLEHIYYSAESDFYKIPDGLVKVGQICATLFPEDSNWHRGIISAVDSEDFIQMYFVDYGNTCLVPRKSIRFLKTRFMELPGQAIQGRLANINPINEEWTKAARSCMLSICRQKPLIALVTSVKDCVMSVCLVDTTTENDIHINDLLVLENYAYLCPDEKNTSLSKPLVHTEIPDYSYVFGWRQPSTKQPTGGAIGEFPVTEQSSASTKCCYVQPNPLCGGDYVVHLVNLEGHPYLLSAEISSFFWEADVLTAMLRQKRSKANKVPIKREDYPQLFEELEQYGVRSVCDGQTTKVIVTLYDLHSVPAIIETFRHPSEQLCADVRLLIDRFSPDDPYWKGEGVAEAEAEGSQDDQEEAEEETLSREELNVTLQALQFKRKRILQSMMSPTGNTAEIVNELNSVEVQIQAIKDLLDYKAPEQSVTPSSPEVATAASNTKQQSSTYMVSSQMATVPVLTTQTSQTAAAAKADTGIKTNIVAPMQQTSPVKPNPQSCSQSESFINPSANQNVLDSFAQQQLLYQSMLASQTAMPAYNPALMNPQFMASMMMLPFNMQNPALSGLGLGTPQLGQFNMLNAPQGLGSLGSTLPALGRGQPLLNNMSLLPGLQPLLENLNLNATPGAGLGRGSGQGSQPGSKPN